jgi:hypothetical protein
VKQFLKITIVAAFLTFVSMSETKAQSVCVPKDYAISPVRGKIVTVEKEIPFPDIPVKFINEAEEDFEKRVVAIVQTDETGNFEFTKVRNGKYLIFVESFGQASFGVRVKVQRKKLNKGLQ